MVNMGKISYFCSPWRNVLFPSISEKNSVTVVGRRTYIRDPSQVIRIVQLNPMIVMKPKFLFKTGFFPRRANAASSREPDPGSVGAKLPTRACAPSFENAFSVAILEAKIIGKAKMDELRSSGQQEIPSGKLLQITEENNIRVRLLASVCASGSDETRRDQTRPHATARRGPFS